MRKSIKRITAIKSQVEEIERSVLKKETVELIRKDAKERVRVNETLMGLILKLDSIRGVSPGIRDCRKAVIKKAVSLQEKVDLIAASPPLDQTRLVSSDEEVVDAEKSNSAAAESVDRAIESANLEDGREGNAHAPEDFKDNVNEDSELENCDEMMDNHEGGVHYESDVNAGEEEEPCVVVKESECVEEMDVEEDDTKQKLIEERRSRDDRKEGNREVLEKMVSENEKMMRMMSQLCERNELQTRMLTSLTQRVERLEKAFLCCDKLRKKKKKHTPIHSPRS